MFSLKFDLLFPSFESAKEMARKLNEKRMRPPRIPANPRDYVRMRAELAAAREKQKLFTVMHRNRIL